MRIEFKVKKPASETLTKRLSVPISEVMEEELAAIKGQRVDLNAMVRDYLQMVIDSSKTKTAIGS